MVATVVSVQMEKGATPRSVSSNINALLRTNKLEPDMPNLLREKLVRNDDMFLLFQQKDCEKYYFYIVGKTEDGIKYVGIIPMSVAKHHKDVVEMMMERFGVGFSNLKGGLLSFKEEGIFVFGTSGIYKAHDHESVRDAIRKLAPEFEDMKIHLVHALNNIVVS